MGFPPRVQAPGVLYHATSRAVDKQPIFGVYAGDRDVFLHLLERVVHRRRWQLHAYCLMGNHFHLVLDTPEANISDGIRDLKSAYAGWFNDVKPREGALFERRFWAAVLDREEHLFAVARYVVLNPVRAGLCAHPAEWPWSSFRSTAGLGAPAPFLDLELLHGMFGGGEVAAARYARFVGEAVGVDLGRVLAQSRDTARTAATRPGRRSRGTSGPRPLP